MAKQFGFLDYELCLEAKEKKARDYDQLKFINKMMASDYPTAVRKSREKHS